MSRDNSKPSPEPGADGAGEASVPGTNAEAKKTGRVQFDSRGNAIWEWSVATGAFSHEVSAERLQRLEHPALSIADDASTPFATVRANPLGTKKGYDPYDSGKLGKAAAARKKDLRRLSEFMKLKKQAASNKNEKE